MPKAGVTCRASKGLEQRRAFRVADQDVSGSAVTTRAVAASLSCNRQVAFTELMIAVEGAVRLR